MTYTSANQLATNNNKPVIYDADGNVTYDPDGNMYIFDSRNRLSRKAPLGIPHPDLPPSTIIGTQYSYDAENNRIKSEYYLEYQDFVVNPESSLSQILLRSLGQTTAPPDADSVKEYYAYGLGLIGYEKQGTYYNYHFDLRGSTIALTNQQGEIVDRFQYGQYGEMVRRTGTSNTVFLYNGRDGVMSDSNGLYYMRARYYDPKMKRFINQDVLRGNIGNGQSLNRYAYVNGNPVSYVDPLGLKKRQTQELKVISWDTFREIQRIEYSFPISILNPMSKFFWWRQVEKELAETGFRLNDNMKAEITAYRILETYSATLFQPMSSKIGTTCTGMATKNSAFQGGVHALSGGKFQEDCLKNKDLVNAGMCPEQ